MVSFRQILLYGVARTKALPTGEYIYQEVEVPDDYIIVGYDGVDISNYVYPSLSYVRQPFEKLADTIVDVLLRKINGENLTDDVVVNDVRFIKGNTTR